MWYNNNLLVANNTKFECLLPAPPSDARDWPGHEFKLQPSLDF